MNVFNRLIAITKWIIRHPLNKGYKHKAIARFVLWQINSRLYNYSIIMPWVNKTQLIVRKGISLNLYAGLSDFNEMSFLLHFLRKGDTFVDIGANEGSYSVLASGVVGAYSIAIEPILETYNRMVANVYINGIPKLVDTLNIGLGRENGMLRFTNLLDSTVNHVAMEDEINTVEVPVRTLDSIVGERTTPALIKIDVEGFETDVIRSGTKTLADKTLKVIIIELNSSGLRYGYKDEDIHSYLLKLDFLPYSYDPFKRKLILLDSFSQRSNNVIYVRDILYVNNRILNADKFTIMTEQI